MVLPFDKIYFISLDKASGLKRRTALLKQFEDLGIENQPEWIKASDGQIPSHHIDNSFRKKNLRRGAVSSSEVGCFESHRKAWQLFKESGLQTCLILEDDALFKDAETVSRSNFLPQEWDLLHFGFIRNKASIVEKLELVYTENFRGVWSGSGMWLTHAYAINQTACQIMLQETTIQTGGLDWQWTGFQHKFRTLGFMPGIIIQQPISKFPSQIHHTS